MNITSDTLTRQYKALTFGKRRALRKAAARSPHVDYPLLCAIASRETNMRNIVGDGGHGRGVFQQDDRFQQPFLSATRGCRNGSSIPIYRSALPKGRVPTITAGARRCVNIIEGNIREAERQGVPDGHRLHVALSAYNAGMGGAMKGWRASRNPDAETAGGNYGKDVLERAAVLRRLA
jgi:hypothetical protein